MTDDQHPADSLIEAIKGTFDGDNIRQSIRDAWDRITGQQQAQPQPQPAQQTNWKPEPNAQQQQEINRNALTSAQAAKIRSKVR